jgi:hypothetical protein
MFLARPGWAAAAIACLAIAIGANTAAFTLVNALLLRPLPFDQPDQLIVVALRALDNRLPGHLRCVNIASSRIAPGRQPRCSLEHFSL